MSFGIGPDVAYNQLPVNLFYPYVRERFKEKISFTRLVFSGCANYALEF